jgi:hypothetical protein
VSTTASQKRIAPGRNNVDGIACRPDGNGFGEVVNEISTFLLLEILKLPAWFANMTFPLTAELCPGLS